MPADPVRFVVAGEPRSKARPRVVVRGGRVKTFTDKDTVAAEKTVALVYKSAVNRAGVKVDKTATFGLRMTFRCATMRRRDLDNMVKLVLDGLNGVAFDDDSQVTEITANLIRGVGAAAAATVVEVYETDWRAAGFTPPASAFGQQTELPVGAQP